MLQQKNFSKADLWLFIAISAYFIMNGAQLWETAIMVPAWTAEPPASLVFFQEPYALDFKVFWIVVHSIHEVLFILALFFNWRIPGRKIPLLLLFVAHVGVRAWTLMYFAPTIIEFQQIPASATVDQELVEKAAQWRNMNYLRVGIFFIINISLIPLFRINRKQMA
jgi:hypothetical protein